MKIVDGWIDTATEIDYGNKSMDRQGYRPTHIVLHGTAGGTSSEVIANYFKTSNVDASAHIIIGTDGEVTQGISMDVAAWANGVIDQPTIPWPANVNPNLYTISIEHCKPSTDNSDQLTDAQKQASFQVIQTICDYYHIAKMRGNINGGIVSHADFDMVNRARCPGPYPWDELITYLNQSGGGDTTVLDISQASQYFTEVTKDQRWHCKQTGFDVAYGILTYYRTCIGVALNGLSQYGLPISGELPIPGVQGASFQRFERGVIVFDAAHKADSVPGISGPCYPGHIDKYFPQSSQNAPQPPVVTINTSQAVSTINSTITALSATITGLQGVVKDLEPS
jgi:N-acetyl-anhydromuramyl-L-alanine amidase AmpD